MTHVKPCPDGFLAGYYWYGNKRKGPGRPPRDATNCADVIDDTSLQDVSTDSTAHQSTPRDSDDRQIVGTPTSDEQIGAADQLPMSEQECTSNDDGQSHHSNEKQAQPVHNPRVDPIQDPDKSVNRRGKYSLRKKRNPPERLST